MKYPLEKPLLLLVCLPSLALPGSGCSTPAGARASGPGRIVGQVVYTGTPPREPTMNIPEAGLIEAHTVIVDPETRGLKNVALWLEGVPSPPDAVTATPPVVDQVNFVFTPHVLAVRAGQPVRFTSSDPVNHSVHAHSDRSENEFHVYVTSAGDHVHRFIRPGSGEPVLLTCELHHWMRAWIYVHDHPWFAVTGSDGSFAIDGVPPGSCRLALDHADGGLRHRQEISVRPGEVTRVRIELPAPPGTSP